MRGNNAWKKASEPATTKASVNLISFFMIPQVTETANESKLKPIASSRNVINSVNF